jgi:hypothetical protein
MGQQRLQGNNKTACLLLCKQFFCACWWLNGQQLYKDDTPVASCFTATAGKRAATTQVELCIAITCKSFGLGDLRASSPSSTGQKSSCATSSRITAGWRSRLTANARYGKPAVLGNSCASSGDT